MVCAFLGQFQGDAKALPRPIQQSGSRNVDDLAHRNENVTRVAKALGVSRTTLQNKIKLYGLRNERT